MGTIPTLNFFLSESASSSSDYDNPLAWVKVLVFLIVLSLIAFSLNYFSKKRNLNTLENGKSKLSIIDTCSLGNRQFIVVAQYESARHLLAVGSTGISHLTELPKKEAQSLENPQTISSLNQL